MIRFSFSTHFAIAGLKNAGVASAFILGFFYKQLLSRTRVA